MGLIIETDLGRDADDLFALLWLLEKGVQIDAITITPGDPDQVAVAEGLNTIYGKNIPIGTSHMNRAGRSSNPFHAEFLSAYGLKTVADVCQNAGVCTIYDNWKADTEFLVLGPCTNLGDFLTIHDKPITKATMQGGFLQCDAPKFLNKVSCPTFNLGGDRLASQKFLDYPIAERRMVGKNVGHTKCMFHGWMLERFKSGTPLHTALKLFLKHSDYKKFQDPMAAVLHFHPHLGHWVKGKTCRKGGEWWTDLECEEDFILQDIDEGAFWSYFTGENHDNR